MGSIIYPKAFDGVDAKEKFNETDDGPFPFALDITRVRTGASRPGGYAKGNVLGSYLHLNFMGSPAAADHFLRRCLEFRNSGGPREELGPTA